MIKEKIKKLRKEKGLSHREVGEAIGFSTSHVGRMESGERDISISHLYKFANFFNVDITWFFEKPNVSAEIIELCLSVDCKEVLKHKILKWLRQHHYIYISTKTDFYGRFLPKITFHYLNINIEIADNNILPSNDYEKIINEGIIIALKCLKNGLQNNNR